MILHLLIDIFHLFCYLNFLIHLLLLKMIQFQHILRHLKIFQPLYLLLQILHLQLLLYHLHCNLLFLLKLLFFGLCCIFHLLYFLNLLIKLSITRGGQINSPATLQIRINPFSLQGFSLHRKNELHKQEQLPELPLRQS